LFDYFTWPENYYNNKVKLYFPPRKVLALEGIVKAIIKARKKEKKIRGHKGGKWDPGEGIVWFSPPRGIGIGICLD